MAQQQAQLQQLSTQLAECMAVQRQHTGPHGQTFCAAPLPFMHGSMTDAPEEAPLTSTQLVLARLRRQFACQQQVLHQLLQLHPVHEQYRILQQAIAQTVTAGTQTSTSGSCTGTGTSSGSCTGTGSGSGSCTGTSGCFLCMARLHGCAAS